MPSHQVHVGLLLGLILGLLIIGVHGHGSLTQPRPRNLITYITQARNDLLGRVEISGTWIKDHGNGHGRAVVKPTWGPGEMADGVLQLQAEVVITLIMPVADRPNPVPFGFALPRPQVSAVTPTSTMMTQGPST